MMIDHTGLTFGKFSYKGTLCAYMIDASSFEAPIASLKKFEEASSSYITEVLNALNGKEILLQTVQSELWTGGDIAFKVLSKLVSNSTIYHEVAQSNGYRNVFDYYLRDYPWIGNVQLQDVLPPPSVSLVKQNYLITLFAAQSNFQTRLDQFKQAVIKKANGDLVKRTNIPELLFYSANRT